MSYSLGKLSKPTVLGCLTKLGSCVYQLMVTCTELCVVCTEMHVHLHKAVQFWPFLLNRTSCDYSGGMHVWELYCDLPWKKHTYLRL